MKHNWSSGYVADLTYSYGYYHELSPSFLRFFLLMNGWSNGSQGGTYDYCELGYGQGVSCNLHAAANPRGRFHGTDFNPDHALYAQGLAREAGLQADWRALGFEDMLDADLPPLDFVTLHGVWSWIDAAARHALVEFLRRRLKVGGVVYVSYNVLPGWSPEKPLRDLLWMHTELAGASGSPTATRIGEALAFADRLRQGKAAFFDRNGAANQMLDDMMRDDMHVVAHEYFNRSWHLTYFSELAQALEAAGLSFGCSVHRSDLTGEVFHRTQPFQLASLPPLLRQTTHDFILNRRFRRDVFVRGGNRLPPARRREMLEQVSLVLLRPAANLSATQQTPYGSVTLDAQIVDRLAAALDTTPGPVKLIDLIRQAELNATPRERVFETVAALVAQSLLCPVFDDDAKARDDARAAAMNRVVADRARHDDHLRYLCSPVTGQGLEVNRVDRLLLAAWLAGARTPAQLCAGATLADDGAAGSPGAPTPEELRDRAQQFAKLVLPLWQRLGIVEEAA